MHGAVELEHRVAADHERVGQTRRHRVRLEPGQLDRQYGGVGGHLGLVGLGHDHLGADARAAQRGQAGGRGGGEDQPGPHARRASAARSGSSPIDQVERLPVERLEVERVAEAGTGVLAGLEPDPLAHLVRRRLPRPAE